MTGRGASRHGGGPRREDPPISTQELLESAQRATLRLGADTLQRLSELDTTPSGALRETLTDRRDRALASLRHDRRTQYVAAGVAAGVLVGGAVWLWRRRRARRAQDEAYTNDVTHLGGWQTPDEAFQVTS